MIVRTACPHDCFDCCGIEAEVKDGAVVALKGSQSHPVTRGFLCGKVQGYLRRQYSKDRLLYPLRREGSSFRRIGWEEALDEVACGLERARALKGPSSVLSYSDAGSMGYLKSLEGRFWGEFGGATFASGSLCSAAGLEAMAADYGRIGQHDPEDIPNSRLIALWGRNPMVTNIHMVPYIRKAKERGAKVVLVNPMPSESEALADYAVKPRPGSDAALALGLAREIIASDMHDGGYIGRHVEGYASYLEEAMSWTLGRTSDVTGVPVEDIRMFARDYALVKPASIWLGFGLQRHAGGGNAVRAVNALGAITGNIGRPGGGVNYSNRSSRVLNPLGYEGRMKDVKLVWKGRLADDIRALGDGFIEMAVIARSNPMLQCPDTEDLERVFEKIPLKVVFEHFMTDTAKAADIVLPAATFLEEDELYYSYFHNYVSLGRKAVEPLGEARPDIEIMKGMAERLGIGCLSGRTALEWIRYALEPMEAYGITLDRLMDEGWVRFPAPMVPWQDGKFPTASGRIMVGSPAPPKYIPPHELPDKDHPFYLITGALRDRLHSQYDNLGADPAGLQAVYVHPEAARRLGLKELSAVEVYTKHAAMRFLMVFDDRMRQDVIYAHHGRWKDRNGGINRLIKGYLADMGGQGALYDCAAGIRPSEVR